MLLLAVIPLAAVGCWLESAIRRMGGRRPMSRSGRAGRRGARPAIGASGGAAAGGRRMSRSRPVRRSGLTVICSSPSRGRRRSRASPHDEGTIILAFDVSGSMAADDLAPTRMEAAKAAARDFVKRQPPSVVIGVVAFSDSGFSVQVPTNDPAPILAAIDRLQPQRGTSLAQGIKVSLDTIAAAEGDQNQGYYTNRSPDPNPTPEPSPVPPGTHTSAGDRAADRRREHRQPRPARGGPGRGRPRRAHPHHRHRQRRGHDAQGRGSRSTRSSTRRRSSRSRP